MRFLVNYCWHEIPQLKIKTEEFSRSPQLSIDYYLGIHNFCLMLHYVLIYLYSLLNGLSLDFYAVKRPALSSSTKANALRFSCFLCSQ